MSRITVLIAHPDATEAARLRAGLQADPDIALVGIACNLMDTFTVVEEHLPNVVVVAERLVFAPEFEVMCALFDTLDVRWLIIRGDGGRRGANSAKPPGKAPMADLFGLQKDSQPEDIIGAIRSLARASRSAQPRFSTTAAAMGAPPDQGRGHIRKDRLVLIGASTGGVDALLQVLRAFPADCPPTVICQHTGRGFGRSLVSLLDHQCAARVVAAEPDMPLPAGTICVAAGMSVHAVVAGAGGLRVRHHEGPPVEGHRPSVDVLFRSALPVARQTVAALLTGMGRDGAQGLLALRQRGAETLVQDKATSVVYGMPRAARELSAAKRELALGEIGPAIIELCSTAPIRRGATG